MDVDIRMREEQLKTLDAFIKTSHDRIDEILNPIGWTREYLLKEDRKMVVCPLNSKHHMPEETLEKHLPLCLWHKEGYSDDDTPLPENSIENPRCVKTSITIDGSLQAAVLKEAKQLNPHLMTGDLESDERPVAQTSDRYFAEFTPDERRVLYDYVISQTAPAEGMRVEELQMFDDKKGEKTRPKSKLELLIEERDAKRRRISYRKKVHTNRKTQTEILREVIQNQMELLEQLNKGEVGDEENSSNCPQQPDTAQKKCTETPSSSHENQRRGEFDGKRERYGRQFHPPPSYKRQELSERSDEYSSSKSHAEYPRERREHNGNSEWSTRGYVKHSREPVPWHDDEYREERYGGRQKDKGSANMSYEGKRISDHSVDGYCGKHKSRSNYRNFDYELDGDRQRKENRFSYRNSDYELDGDRQRKETRSSYRNSDYELDGDRQRKETRSSYRNSDYELDGDIQRKETRSSYRISDYELDGDRQRKETRSVELFQKRFRSSGSSPFRDYQRSASSDAHRDIDRSNQDEEKRNFETYKPDKRIEERETHKKHKEKKKKHHKHKSKKKHKKHHSSSSDSGESSES